MVLFDPTFELVSGPAGVWETVEVQIDFPETPTTDFATGVAVEAILEGPTGRVRLEGFCDCLNGVRYLVRGMPTAAGPHRLEVRVRAWNRMFSESFQWEAEDRGRPGPVERREDAPFHFRYRGTGEPFFWNGTTAYLILGLSDEKLEAALVRLAGKGINHLRVSIAPSRQLDGGRWYEPQVGEREDFTYRYGPWIARNPASAMDPQFDVDRWDIEHWRKLDRLVRRAHELGMEVQAIFFTDAQEDQNYPFDRQRLDEDPAEARYYAYGVARLSGFPNVEFCVTNEWALYRADESADRVGARIRELDPYGHLLSVHGHGHFPFRKSPWCSHALFQAWDDGGGYRFMRANRAAAIEAGAPMPQINEEFGYEDHYSAWGEGRVAPMRAAETRVRLIWEICFAGGYATNGESAANGLGGWINGLGDDSMTMLDLQRHVRTFFEGFEWWKLEPHDGLTAGHAYVLSDGSETVAVYVYGGGSVSVKLPDEGPWTLDAFDCRTGEWSRVRESEPMKLDEGTGPGFLTPVRPYGENWAFLARRG